MTIGIMDGKQAAQVPAVTVVQQTEGDNQRTRRSLKPVVIAVTCVIIAAILLTGIVVGVKLFLNHANDIVTHHYKFANKNGQKSEEDVDISVKRNFVQYNVMNDDTKVTVLHDYNLDLQLMKMNRQGVGSICYVSKLNRSDTSVPQALLDHEGSDDVLATQDQEFEKSDSPIYDRSVLGPHGHKMCRNIDVHWLYPSATEEEESTDHNIQKRAVTRRKQLVNKCQVRYCYQRLVGRSWRAHWKTYCLWWAVPCSTTCQVI